MIIGALGVFAWVLWIYGPPCTSSEPIAPGVCPASPSYIEVQGLLFALVFLIVASLIALAYSFVKSTSVAATQG